MLSAILARFRRAPEPPASPEPIAPVIIDPLTDRDRERLAGVHPDLVRVVREARRHAAFIVVEGLRSRQRQAELMAEGKSRTMDSRHITGHAVDLAPLVEGVVSWDWAHFHPLAAEVKRAAARNGVAITWGGDWKSFPDGPHFELSRTVYPA